jgi:hypothetical protein
MDKGNFFSQFRHAKKQYRLCRFPDIEDSRMVFFAVYIMYKISVISKVQAYTFRDDFISAVSLMFMMTVRDVCDVPDDCDAHDVRDDSDVCGFRKIVNDVCDVSSASDFRDV